jgi:autophagy-related protein 2
LHVTKDLDYLAELAAFAKTPEGVFEDVVPSEVTRINVQMYDTSVRIEAPNVGGAVVAVLGTLEVKLDVLSDAEESSVDVSAGAIALLLIDDVSTAGTLTGGQTSSVDAWKVGLIRSGWGLANIR